MLRMGSINEIIANMRKVDEDKLFKGIQNHNYESFWEINSTLSDKHVADMKKYAVRIHSNKLDRALQPTCEIAPFELAGEKSEQESNASFVKWEQTAYDETLG